MVTKLFIRLSKCQLLRAILTTQQLLMPLLDVSADRQHGEPLIGPVNILENWKHFLLYFWKVCMRKHTVYCPFVRCECRQTTQGTIDWFSSYSRELETFPCLLLEGLHEKTYVILSALCG